MDAGTKRTADLIDELSIVNVKIFFLEERVSQLTDLSAIGQTAVQIRVLNRQRSALRNALAARLDRESSSEVKV